MEGDRDGFQSLIKLGPSCLDKKIEVLGPDTPSSDVLDAYRILTAHQQRGEAILKEAEPDQAVPAVVGVRLKSDRLRGWSEQDFIDVDVVRLVHGKCDGAGEGLCTDGDLANELLRASLNILFADVFQEFSADRAG